MLSLAGGPDFLNGSSGFQEKKVEVATPLKAQAQNSHGVTSATLCWSKQSEASRHSGEEEIDPISPGRSIQEFVAILNPPPRVT